MNSRSVAHGSFTIERTYKASAAQVFAAWRDPDIKARWFVGPAGWTPVERSLDFRVGGQELAHGRFPGGPDTIFRARYHDIVANERIVYTYDMQLDAKHLSTSLATVEITPDGSGTRLTFTEQAVFLDGYDGLASREQGSAGLLDQLGSTLESMY